MAPISREVHSVSLLLVPYGVAAGDQVIWSANSSAVYYHSAVQQYAPGVRKGWVPTRGTPTCLDACAIGYDEIHRVDLNGHDTVLWHRVQDGSSLRLVGLDRSGALIVTLARPHQPVLLLRVETHNEQGTLQQSPGVVATLPADILPGNVLRIGSDGESVECERVLNWRPLRTIVVQIGFGGRGAAHQVDSLFDTARYGQAVTALNRSTDGTVLVMSHVLSIRADLAAEGNADVPAQESLLLADAHTGAVQRLTLPYGAQIVQTFWTAHIPLSQLHIVPVDVLAGLLAFHQRLGGGGKNASVIQQDEWMLEGHANLLFDGPALPQMCYAYCSKGLTGVPHVSAAILHGVAYVESNWHQFNTTDYNVNGEPVGSPVESFDGG